MCRLYEHYLHLNKITINLVPTCHLYNENFIKYPFITFTSKNTGVTIFSLVFHRLNKVISPKLKARLCISNPYVASIQYQVQAVKYIVTYYHVNRPLVYSTSAKYSTLQTVLIAFSESPLLDHHFQASPLLLGKLPHYYWGSLNALAYGKAAQTLLKLSNELFVSIQNRRIDESRSVHRAWSPARQYFWVFLTPHYFRAT